MGLEELKKKVDSQKTREPKKVDEIVPKEDVEEVKVKPSPPKKDTPPKPTPKVDSVPTPPTKDTPPVPTKTTAKPMPTKPVKQVTGGKKEMSLSDKEKGASTLDDFGDLFASRPSYVTMLIYGGTYSGKTTFALSSERQTLVGSTDGNATYIAKPHQKVMMITNAEQLEKFLEILFKTKGLLVVLDRLDMLVDIVYNKKLEDLGVQYATDISFGGAYEKQSQDQMAVGDLIINLCRENGHTLVMLTDSESETTTIGKGKDAIEKVITRPYIPSPSAKTKSKLKTGITGKTTAIGKAVKRGGKYLILIDDNDDELGSRVSLPSKEYTNLDTLLKDMGV